MTFVKGNHVSLRLPGALLHGVDVTRAPCIVLEEVRPQAYRLLSTAGILDTLYTPGDLQSLTGHTFSSEVQVVFDGYKPGTSGDIAIGAVVRDLTGEP